MAEMKTLNGNTFVDQTARDELATLKQTVSGIPKFSIEVVTALPTITEASTATVYLVPSVGADGNLYTEWICVEHGSGLRAWEKLGVQNLDLTGYVTDEELSAAINAALAQAKASGEFDGEDGKSAYAYAKDGGYSGTESDFAKKLAKDYDAIISEKVEKTGISLGIASDGLIYVFVDGTPVGTGIPQGQSGDVLGFVDENNTIVLTGNLADGTYTVKYEMDNGTVVNVGNMVLDNNVYYSVKSTLTNCSNSNGTTTVVKDGSYSATITANSGYNITSVKVTMGGTDITSSVYSNGKITITNVTGNIVITATASANTYSVTKNLTNCSISNSETAVSYGASYSATVTANDGYELKSVTVTMGGANVSVTNGVINIASVTGNIVITAVANMTAVLDPVTVDIELTDGIRLGSDGGDRTQAGYCATHNIDLTNIPKPCTINLTKARWCGNTTTGMIRVHATKADGTVIINDTTRTDVGGSYFTVVDNSGIGNDVTVTITSADVGYIRFSAQWASKACSDSDVSFAAANTKATLTYTPLA